jgi:hypothetical protein
MEEEEKEEETYHKNAGSKLHRNAGEYIQHVICKKTGLCE